MQERVLQGGSDLGEGFEDEAAPVQGWVGEGEVRVGEHQAAARFGGGPISGVEEQVEIDGAGALGGVIGGADAAHGGFDGEKGAQEFERAEGGFEQRGGVGEARLVTEAYGVGFVEAGGRDDGAETGEAVKSLAEVFGGGAEGRREIGAEGDGS